MSGNSCRLEGNLAWLNGIGKLVNVLNMAQVIISRNDFV